MKKLLLLMSIVVFASCGDYQPSSDEKDSQRQEQLQKEGSAQIGMPTIHNFQEKKMVKMLYELRDNPNLVNYAYLFSEMTGKYTFFGKCIGYGIPYSTQFLILKKKFIKAAIIMDLAQCRKPSRMVCSCRLHPRAHG